MTFKDLAHSGTSTATTYHFSDGGFGWAYAFVHDANGLLAIVSDWGTWSHRWPTDPRTLGASTLTEFIGSMAGADYMANKLCTRAQRQQFDPHKTVDKLQSQVAKARLKHGRTGGLMNAAVAREIWSDLEELRYAYQEDVFVHLASDIDNIYTSFDPALDDLEYIETIEFTILRDRILPKLKEACRGNIQK